MKKNNKFDNTVLKHKDVLYKQVMSNFHGELELCKLVPYHNNNSSADFVAVQCPHGYKTGWQGEEIVVAKEEQWIKDTRQYEESIRNKNVKELCNAASVTQMRYSLRVLLDHIELTDSKQDTGV